MEKELYITDDCLIEDETYSTIKLLIKCFICNKILKDPMMCNNCQKVFCKACIENYPKKDKKCPNKCKNPEYKISGDKNAMLSLLKFRCRNCKGEIKYNDVKSHLDSGCETNVNSTRLADSIYIKKKLIKLTNKEIQNITELGNQINHLSSKI